MRCRILNKDQRKQENSPENVVDINQLRYRRDRRKAQQAQQKSWLGTLRAEFSSKEKTNQQPETARRQAPSHRQQSSGQRTSQPGRRQAARTQPMPQVIRGSAPEEKQTHSRSQTGWTGGIPKHLLGAMVAACIVLTVAIMVALGMNLFVVRTIEVKGGVHYTPNEVISAAGLKEGQSIFSVNAAMIRTELQSTPQLQLVSVDRQLPNVVILTVKETTPTLVAGYMNQYVTLDEELRVLSQAGVLPEGDYPLITGMVVRSANMAEKITADDKLQLEALENIIACFSVRSETAENDMYAPLYYITEIQLTDVDNLKLYTKNGYSVELGTVENMERKALWVEQMVPMFIEKGYTGGTLDVAGSDSATFIPSQGQGMSVTTTPAAQPDEPAETTTAEGEE